MEESGESNVQNVEEEQQTTRSSGRGSKGAIRRGIGSLGDNIKGALQGNKKDLFVLKVKGTLIAILGALAIFVILIEGIAEETSTDVVRAADTVYEKASKDSESAKLYTEKGSLLLSTEKELDEIAKIFNEKLERQNEAYYDALQKKYFGGKPETVANKVKNITVNYDSNEVAEIPVVTGKPSSKGTNSSESRTILEHILRAEKYNFNNVIWNTYKVGKLQGSTSLVKDKDSGLVYPAQDSNAVGDSDHDLGFFVSMLLPYVQSWYIPFDLMIGTEDAQKNSNLNTDFAYSIINNAYHEIVMDRYQMRSKQVTANYIVYDKTTTVNEVVRTCKKYRVSSIVTNSSEVGQICDKDDYTAGLCEDVTEIPNNITGEMEQCADLPAHIQDNTACKYGVKKAQVSNTYQTYCVDTEVPATPKTIYDLREEVKKPVEKIPYSWTYVVSSAKVFDSAIYNKYTFTPYYSYDYKAKLKAFYKAQSASEKKVSYEKLVEEFAESEKKKSKADTYRHKADEYSETDNFAPGDFDISGVKNSNYIYVKEFPKGYTLVQSYDPITVKRSTKVEKVGKQYTDYYEWNDKLDYQFDDSKKGIYNTNSVKDITGDDLSQSDNEYYSEIYKDQEINLIDLLNSNQEIYKNFLSSTDQNTQTTNIGIRRNFLDISYNVLRKDLSNVYAKGSLLYGTSLGITGASLLSGAMIVAGQESASIVSLAESFADKGIGLSYFLNNNKNGIFTSSHWCAMFVSYCVRTVEEQTGTPIPMKTFWGCTTFRRESLAADMIGFYDVIGNRSSLTTTDPKHLAPLERLQPGDVILRSYTHGADWRDHTAIVKSVEKNAEGKVTTVVTIDGNYGGSGNDSAFWNSSSVKTTRITGSQLTSIASFVSIPEVIAAARATAAPTAPATK